MIKVVSLAVVQTNWHDGILGRRTNVGVGDSIYKGPTFAVLGRRCGDHYRFDEGVRKIELCGGEYVSVLCSRTIT